MTFFTLPIRHYFQIDDAIISAACATPLMLFALRFDYFAAVMPLPRRAPYAFSATLLRFS